MIGGTCYTSCSSGYVADDNTKKCYPYCVYPSRVRRICRCRVLRFMCCAMCVSWCAGPRRALLRTGRSVRARKMGMCCACFTFPVLLCRKTDISPYAIPRASSPPSTCPPGYTLNGNSCYKGCPPGWCVVVDHFKNTSRVSHRTSLVCAGQTLQACAGQAVRLTCRLISAPCAASPG